MCCKERVWIGRGHWYMTHSQEHGWTLPSQHPFMTMAGHDHGPTAEQSRAHCLSRSSCRAVMPQAQTREGPALSPLGMQGRARCQGQALARMLLHCFLHPLWLWGALQAKGIYSPMLRWLQGYSKCHILVCWWIIIFRLLQALPCTIKAPQRSLCASEASRVASPFLWGHPLCQADYHAAVTLLWLP